MDIERVGWPSEAPRSWCDRATELVLSVIAVPELISAFRRLVHEGRLSEPQYSRIRSELLADLVDALVCDTSPQVIQKAVEALEAQPLRAMDAIQVASAQVSGADVFVSADMRQCEAARRLGLDVVAL